MLQLIRSPLSLTDVLVAIFVGLFVIIMITVIMNQARSQSKPVKKPFITSTAPAKSVQLIDKPPQRKTEPQSPFSTVQIPSSITERPISGVASSLSAVSSQLTSQVAGVRLTRGGEFIGNRMRFKAKVTNESTYTITDVKIYLLSYPHEALRLIGEDDKFFSKIEPNGFRSPSFDFLPTQDCVRGNIVAAVSFMDMRGQPHTLIAKPFVIRSVCDLLIPEQMSPQDFALMLKKLEHGEVNIRVNEWTPEEMHEKVLRILDDSNFFEVDSKIENSDGVIFGQITGSAKGKYTGKSVAVEIMVTGPSGRRGASCIIRVSGEDQAMILPAIDDLKERLSAWLCPLCGSPLTLENVEDLKDGKAICCPFCRISISR
ncbi:MAG: hypothetical protein ACFFCT_03080 [Candidatus Odinarchaeota archaeon]